MPCFQNQTAIRLRQLFGVLVAALFSAPLAPQMASALTLDFEGFAHGEVVNSFGDVAIEVENFIQGRPIDWAVAFDSEASGTADPDLEAAWNGLPRWSRGNLEGVMLGNILIIQEEGDGCATGLCDEADDEGGRAAGTITLDFAVPTLHVGFDLIDLDDVMAERGSITLFDALGGSVTLDFEDVAALNSGVEWGNNSANRMAPLVAEAFDLGPIVSARFLMGGSGAIDNIEVEYAPIPEPATAVLMGIGLLGLGHAGTRRS